MDREEALAYLNSMFDAQMTIVGRDLDDSATGYGPALDSAFRKYIAKNSLETSVTETTVPAADEDCFLILLEATTYDLMLPLYAGTQVDFSVDAPLTSIKYSQAYRQMKDARDEAWYRASACGGYGYAMDNVAGFRVNLDYLEPVAGSGNEYA